MALLTVVTVVVLIAAGMGAYAKRTSVQRGFLIAVGAAAALSLTALVLVLRR